MYGEHLCEDLFICSYWSDTLKSDDYVVPRNAAVQISAAITAYARIYMHPFISREDCYYTDKDSVVLGNPLPEEVISKDELGSFKLEYLVQEGIFLAPKSYWLDVEGSKDVLVHKGAVKSHVTKEWFQQQYLDKSLTKKVVVTNNFRVQIKSFRITKQESEFILGLYQKRKS